MHTMETGVQNIFYDDPNVLVISIHDPAITCFPAPVIYEQGSDEGYGYTINCPWNHIRMGPLYHCLRRL